MNLPKITPKRIGIAVAILAILIFLLTRKRAAAAAAAPAMTSAGQGGQGGGSSAPTNQTANTQTSTPYTAQTMATIAAGPFGIGNLLNSTKNAFTNARNAALNMPKPLTPGITPVGVVPFTEQ